MKLVGLDGIYKVYYTFFSSNFPRSYWTHETTRAPRPWCAALRTAARIGVVSLMTCARRPHPGGAPTSTPRGISHGSHSHRSSTPWKPRSLPHMLWSYFHRIRWRLAVSDTAAHGSCISDSASGR